MVHGRLIPFRRHRLRRLPIGLRWCGRIGRTIRLCRRCVGRTARLDRCWRIDGTIRLGRRATRFGCFSRRTGRLNRLLRTCGVASVLRRYRSILSEVRGSPMSGRADRLRHWSCLFNRLLLIRSNSGRWLRHRLRLIRSSTRGRLRNRCAGSFEFGRCAYTLARFCGDRSGCCYLSDVRSSRPSNLVKSLLIQRLTRMLLQVLLARRYRRR